MALQKHFCRLDFFLVSVNLVAQTNSCDILPGFKTDHSSIVINFSATNVPRGRGFWKFNVSLLHDEIYVEKVRNCINVTKSKYVDYMNPILFLDFLKCQIRSLTIEYSIQKSRQKRREENNLLQRIAFLEDLYSTTATPSIEAELIKTKNELEHIYEKKAEGIIVRSRANWVENGEKNTRYFINLEKRNQRQKTITKLYNDSGTVITSHKDILSAEREYFEKIYSSCNPSFLDFEQYFSPTMEHSKLSEDSQQLCEGSISLQECLNALKTMKNNKSPGTDGIPVEFYKYFFKDIGSVLIHCYNYSFREGIMSDEQKRAIINLIPKKGKDPLYLNNWRPISLLNSDYKILAKCIALRLNKVIPSIISSDQTGFVQGRFIGENIRLTLDMIDYINQNNLSGFLLLVDFEKAFDKLEWEFIFHALRFFNFGPDLISWVKVLYKDISSCIINNGHATDFFPVRCGVRQGCPLSPLLFNIGIELLSLWIRNDKHINGISLCNANIRLSLYADDVTLFLKNVKDLQRVLHILDCFKKFSGLNMNRNKSELIALGYYKAHPPDVTFSGLSYSKDPVKLLGIVLESDPSELFRLNYLPKIDKLKNILHIWSYRDLTPLGKITIVKSLALSQLTFLFSVLPNPPSNFIREIEKAIYSFVWSGKPDKIHRQTIIGDYNQGGLKMPHIQSMLSGLKIAWVKRLLAPNNKGKWKHFFELYLEPFGGNLIWDCNMDSQEDKIMKIQNSFIKEVVRSWCHFTYTPVVKPSELQNQYLWNNSLIRIQRNTFVKKQWIESGITQLKHLLRENGTILSYFDLKKKYNLDCHYAEYFSLKCAIPTAWISSLQNFNPSLEVENTSQNKCLIEIMKTAKVCKFITKQLIDKIIKVPISQEKWSEFFQDCPIDWKNVYTTPFRSCRSTKMRYFQFRLLHRILGVNEYTFIMGITNSKLCSFCKNAEESIVHLFWNCPIVQNFISELKISILENIPVECVSFLFGNSDWNRYFNFVVLHAKYYIFTCKLKNVIPEFIYFKNSLELAKRIEDYISVKNNKFLLSLCNGRNVSM